MASNIYSLHTYQAGSVSCSEQVLSDEDKAVLTKLLNEIFSVTSVALILLGGQQVSPVKWHTVFDINRAEAITYLYLSRIVTVLYYILICGKLSTINNQQVHLSFRELYNEIMSSKKDERKNDDAGETKLEQQASFTSQQQLPQQEEIRKAMIDAFEEAKNNTQKALEEAAKEIPRYTEAITNYQQQIFHDTKEIVDNYIDSQKNLINSLQQQEWNSYVENIYQNLWPNWMQFPNRQMKETYAKVINRSVDNTFNATMLINNITLANMEAFKTALQRTKESTKEMSSLATNSAKLFEMTREMYVKSLNRLYGQYIVDKTEK